MNSFDIAIAPSRARPSTDSRTCVSAAISENPNVPLAPLIECAARKSALKSSCVACLRSTATMSSSIRSRCSATSSKKPSKNWLMSIGMLLSDRALHDVEKRVGVERLDHPTSCADRATLGLHVIAHLGGKNDDRRLLVLRLFAQRFNEREAIETGHVL